MSEYYVGLMSGTSVDSIDAIIVDLSNDKIQLCETHSHAIPDNLRRDVIALFEPGDNEIDRLGAIDIAMGQLFAQAALQVIKKAGLTPSQVKAIGSHGQTIRHRPSTGLKSSARVEIDNNGFTLQIGDPNTLAELSGVTTVADFRRRDMACGGQGAPFAPAFHQAMMPDNVNTAVFLNMGGIANITLMHNQSIVCGFDTGPANCLMDAWIQQHKHQSYDSEGTWAKSGHVNKVLLAKLLTDGYFSRPPPKSTGREQFTLVWLERHLTNISTELSSVDIQATLLALSSHSIAGAIKALPNQPSVVYCCGGGTKNLALIEALELQCPDYIFTDTTELGIAPSWIEASAFAWFAQRTMTGQTLDLQAVTGANAKRVAGAIYQA